MKATNKMQLYKLIYFSLPALHVSGDVFAHHQEPLTAFTASGNVTNVAAGWCHGWDGTNLFFFFSSTCFGRCFRPSSGALDGIYSIW